MNSDYSFKAAFRLAVFIFKVMLCLTFLLSLVAAAVLFVASMARANREAERAQTKAAAESSRHQEELDEWEAKHAKMIEWDKKLTEAKAKQPPQEIPKQAALPPRVLFDVSGAPLHVAPDAKKSQ